MVRYSHLFQDFPQFIVIHTIKGFGIVSKVEIDVFLELSCFFNDPTDVGNLISGFSAFSKTILNIWKFTVHELLKPGLENFEHYFTSVCTLIILNFTLEIRAAILYFITQGNRHLSFINIIITINNQIMQTEDKLQTH